jgi:Sulfotransferase family
MKGFEGMGYGRDEVVTAFAAFISSFFQAYAASQGKARWADKTPNYVDCLPELWQMFGPEARFVLLVRNGLDVAFSLSDEHRHYPAIDEHLLAANGNVPLAAGRLWRTQNERIERFREDHPEACFAIRYEELTMDPAPTLRPMFEFLGEPWHPRVLEYDRFPHSAGWEDPNVRRRRRIAVNSGRYRAWPADVQSAVREACEPMLSRLGYH